MRGLFLILPILLVPLSACHKKPAKHQSSIDDFVAPAPPGKEEKWVEPEPEDTPKPAPPPAPPEPTSPPPKEGLGFTFGQPVKDSKKLCSKNGTWSKKAERYTCSRAVEGASIPGKPMLSFCGDALCAVGVAVTVEGSEYTAWNARFEELKKALVTLHGPPTVDTQKIPDECKNETFTTCLDSSMAEFEATWVWKTGHKVSLTMRKKKADDGPSAIRFVSISGG
ncbi:MAG: hypothetical protein L6Q84_04445 [Polyangiaceae bacterium]|nr:hypothetical protein [Polyangiaceae bacterium]